MEITEYHLETPAYIKELVDFYSSYEGKSEEELIVESTEFSRWTSQIDEEGLYLLTVDPELTDVEGALEPDPSYGDDRAVKVEGTERGYIIRPDGQMNAVLEELSANNREEAPVRRDYELGNPSAIAKTLKLSVSNYLGSLEFELEEGKNIIAIDHDSLISSDIELDDEGVMVWIAGRKEEGDEGGYFQDSDWL